MYNYEDGDIQIPQSVLVVVRADGGIQTATRVCVTAQQLTVFSPTLLPFLFTAALKAVRVGGDVRTLQMQKKKKKQKPEAEKS